MHLLSDNYVNYNFNNMIKYDRQRENIYHFIRNIS